MLKPLPVAAEAGQVTIAASLGAWRGNGYTLAKLIGQGL